MSFGPFLPFFVTNSNRYWFLSQVKTAPEIQSPLHYAPRDKLG